MQFQTKLLAATALALALAGCGSPAEEADDPAPADEVLTTDEVLSAEPEELSAVVQAAEEGNVEDAAEADEPGASTPQGAAATPTAAARPSPAATTAAAAEPPALWPVCSACHAVEPGEHGIGPSLASVVGSRAASKPGFDYSQPMKDSGLTWNEANLNRYLEDPRGVVPGTSMAYAGLKNAQQRQAMIDYLKTL